MALIPVVAGYLKAIAWGCAPMLMTVSAGWLMGLTLAYLLEAHWRLGPGEGDILSATSQNMLVPAERPPQRRWQPRQAPFLLNGWSYELGNPIKLSVLLFSWLHPVGWFSLLC